MFEKRYEEYVQENEEIAREYRERGLLVEAVSRAAHGLHTGIYIASSRP
jgi:hypothetical protein